MATTNRDPRQYAINTLKNWAGKGADVDHNDEKQIQLFMHLQKQQGPNERLSVNKFCK